MRVKNTSRYHYRHVLAQMDCYKLEYRVMFQNALYMYSVTSIPKCFNLWMNEYPTDKHPDYPTIKLGIVKDVKAYTPRHPTHNWLWMERY